MLLVATLAAAAAGCARRAPEEVTDVNRTLARARSAAAMEKQSNLDEQLRREEGGASRLAQFPTSHTVKRGISRWRIASLTSIYERSACGPVLHQADAARIADPDLVHPGGQELAVPRGKPVEAMMSELRTPWRRYAAGA